MTTLKVRDSTSKEGQVTAQRYHFIYTEEAKEEEEKKKKIMVKKQGRYLYRMSNK